jgi:hypothetical protein
MQAAVVAHPPPSDRRPRPFQGPPGGDVGLVVEVGDDDLVAVLGERLADREADEPDEGGGVHAQAHLPRVVGAQEGRDLGPRLRHHAIDLDALGVAAAALDVVLHQMAVDLVEGGVGDLGAGGVVEEHEIARGPQGREGFTDRLDRKHRAHGDPG